MGALRARHGFSKEPEQAIVVKVNVASMAGESVEKAAPLPVSDEPSAVSIQEILPGSCASASSPVAKEEELVVEEAPVVSRGDESALVEGMAEEKTGSEEGVPFDVVAALKEKEILEKDIDHLEARVDDLVGVEDYDGAAEAQDQVDALKIRLAELKASLDGREMAVSVPSAEMIGADVIDEQINGLEVTQALKSEGKKTPTEVGQQDCVAEPQTSAFSFVAGGSANARADEGTEAEEKADDTPQIGSVSSVEGESASVQAAEGEDEDDAGRPATASSFIAAEEGASEDQKQGEEGVISQEACEKPFVSASADDPRQKKVHISVSSAESSADEAVSRESSHLRADKSPLKDVVHEESDGAHILHENGGSNGVSDTNGSAQNDATPPDSAFSFMAE